MLRPRNTRAALHIATYYLARFDVQGYQNLNYTSWQDAFNGIGALLGVAPATVKNRRDEFDVFFPWRQGWHGFTLPALIIQLNQQMADLDESSIRLLVQQGLQNPESPIISMLLNVADQAVILNSSEPQESSQNQLQTRALTGAAAEQQFLELHEAGRSGFNGKLYDHRLQMAGYDFLIEQEDSSKSYIEVKGLLAEHGGLSLTAKEYRIASRERGKYWLVIISSLASGQPVMQRVDDPIVSLNLVSRFNLVVQQAWQASSAQVSALPYHES